MNLYYDLCSTEIRNTNSASLGPIILLLLDIDGWWLF